MRRRDKVILIVAVALGLSGMAPLSHSQAPSQESIETMRREREQRLRERRERRWNEQFERDQIRGWDEARRRAIGATPAQWGAIRPRLEAVEALSADVHARIWPRVSFRRAESAEAGGMCQWRWARSAEETAGDPNPDLPSSR